MASLSATLIVRNEAAVLPRCLTSLAGLVDEVVVVDTGSTDDSLSIAAAHGARTFHHPWTGDFSAARNAALDQARGDWILYIDADECAAPLERHDLDTTLVDRSLVAATVRFRSRSGFTRYRETRLFRRDPRIRFKNVIHETTMHAIEAVGDADGLQIGESALSLDHYGYDGNQDHKHRRNIPLLRERLTREPTHVYSWNHLGQALDGSGDHIGALAAWTQAIEIVRTLDNRQPLTALPYGSLLLCQDSGIAHDQLLDEALARFPRDCLFHWLHAHRLLARGDAADALPIFESLAAIDAATYCSSDGVAYDERIFGAHAQRGVALCLFRLGRYDASARAAAIAGTVSELPALRAAP